MTKHLETKALFAGYNPADNHGAIKPPMHPSSTFVFRTAAEGAALMETAYGIEGAETPPEGGRSIELLYVKRSSQTD